MKIILKARKGEREKKKKDREYCNLSLPKFQLLPTCLRQWQLGLGRPVPALFDPMLLFLSRGDFRIHQDSLCAAIRFVGTGSDVSKYCHYSIFRIKF